MNWRKLMALATLCILSQPVIGQEKSDKKADPAKAEMLEIGKGKVVIQKPASWKTMPPGMMVDNEFRTPAEGEKYVRITISQATGGVEANVTRWINQFEGATKENSKVEKKVVDQTTVHMVEVSGTMVPMSPRPGVKKEPDYKMLGAILELKDGATIFVKATGPKDLIAEMRDTFVKMIDGLKNK